MAIRHEVYEFVGGHQASKGNTVEDLALGNVKRGGFRLLLADGRALVTPRMYASLKGVWLVGNKNLCSAEINGEKKEKREA